MRSEQSMLAEMFMEFMDRHPTVYHFCDGLASLFESHGFQQLDERESWAGIGSGRYFTTRNGSAFTAFEIGDYWTPGKGLAVIGTHMDANTFKLRPVSKLPSIDGYKRLGVAVYGGPETETWLDRDLSLGGRVITRSPEGKLEVRLCHIIDPIARIPTLATHFRGPKLGQYDPETQYVPVMGYEDENETSLATDEDLQCPIVHDHDLRLLRAIATNIGVKVKDLVHLDLQLFDAQKTEFMGLDQEFITGSRFDDRLCTYTAAMGLITAANCDATSPEAISVFVAYDSEENGSSTRAGAEGKLYETVIERIFAADRYKDLANADTRAQTWAKSFLVSSDVGHASHPSFLGNTLKDHIPRLNTGIALKISPKDHYASDGLSEAFIREVAARNRDVLQVFHVRNGAAEGGTIGPILATNSGIRTVDLGVPVLSMHSCREMTGSKDVELAVRFYRHFYATWQAVDQDFSY